MKYSARLTALFLLAAILTVNGCGGQPADTADTTDTTAAAETTSGYEFGGTVFEPYDFGGRTFRFIVRGDGHNEFRCIDMYAENTNGDLINDAIFERNAAVCEKFYNSVRFIIG